VIDLRLFDLNLLVAFDAMMAERSVTRAARRIGIGQPAMSYALSRLRELFGDDLFVRSSGRMQPTNRAIALAEPVSRILADIRGSILTNRAFRPDAAETTITLAATDYAEVAVLPLLLDAIRSAAPRVRVAVTCMDQVDITTMLEEGAADLAIGTFSDRAEAISQKSEVLFHEDFVCVFDVKACGVAPPIGSESYLQLPQIVISVREDGAEGPGDRGSTSLASVLVTTPHFLSIPLLLHGLRAVAIVPRRLAEGWAEMSGLAISPLPIAAPGFDVSMQWHLRTEADPVQRWVRDLIRRAKPGDEPRISRAIRDQENGGN
jgi:LysR family transcriptional regulator, mexEF-oprN operon transcriptional activator